MRDYEIMIILDPQDVDERNLKTNVEAQLQVVPKEGGTVENINIWGRRKLAYPINKHDEAIYVVVELNAQPATVLELDRKLKLRENVMRTKVLRRDQK